jgi:hypothetical protein
VSRGWKRLYNEELHDLYALLDIIKVIKPRRMKGEGHVTRGRDEKCSENFDQKT